MEDAGREALVPRHLAIVMGVDVDKAGGEPQAHAINDFRRGTVDIADSDNAACAHAHVGDEGLSAAAVYYRRAFDEQIKRLAVFLGMVVLHLCASKMLLTSYH